MVCVLREECMSGPVVMARLAVISLKVLGQPGLLSETLCKDREIQYKRVFWSQKERLERESIPASPYLVQ